MTLEDFEKSLAENKKSEEKERSGRSSKRRKHHHHKHHDSTVGSAEEIKSHNGLKRDSWMEPPSSLDVDFGRNGVEKLGKPTGENVDYDKVLLSQINETKSSPEHAEQLDQTALNRLKARMLKARLRGSADATSLEVEYNSAIASISSRKDSDVVVLGPMDNRMLAGGRKGEVKNVDSKRGRERGLVEENEDMSVEDMVREERRSRGQVGGEGQRFAERIAKDGKFDNDLEYMDENASKLAKRVQRSEISLRNTAISDFQKINRILDNCPLCHHEDTDTPPIAPIVSLATRVYLTLPTEPEISDGGAIIAPIQHRGNLLECDDDEWEEIRVILLLLYLRQAILISYRTL